MDWEHPAPKLQTSGMDPTERATRLTILHRRLEAATSRLEDIATSVDSSHPETVAAINAAGLAPETDHAAAATAPTPQPQEPLPRSIEDFDKFIADDVQAFEVASGKLGGLVEQQVVSAVGHEEQC